MIPYRRYLGILSFLSLCIISPNSSMAEKNVAHSPVSLGMPTRIDHDSNMLSGPSIQVSEAGLLHVAWIQSTHNALALYFIKSPLTQQPLPERIRVNPDSIPVASAHEPPVLAVGQNNEVYLTWTTPHPEPMGKPFSTHLLLSRSLDGGKTFLPPIQVNDDTTPTGHSFDYLTVSPKGSVHISWLDAREGKKDPATYTSFSQDQGATISPNLKIDESSCVCCRTHMTTASDGTLYLAWRKIFPGHIRETVVARSTDNGKSYSPPVIVGHDRWAFDGCPHRPATMGTDRQGRLYVTWYTEGPDDTPGVYLAYSDDHGTTFTPRRQLNHSKGTFPDHPQMAVDPNGRLLVLWEEQSPVRREVVMSYSLDRGATFSPPQKLNTKKSKSPAVAVNTHGQAVAAWQEQITFPQWSTVIQPLTWPQAATP